MTRMGVAAQLRQAFLDATADVSGPHTIDATGVTGTISLQSALPAVAGNSSNPWDVTWIATAASASVPR